MCKFAQVLGDVVMGVFFLQACSPMTKASRSLYTVDANTVWQTVELTTAGMHYGVDIHGVSRNGPIRTVWLQRRSANSPYAYDAFQLNIDCSEQQFMLMMRTLIENNQVTGIQNDAPLAYRSDTGVRTPFAQWLTIEPGSREEKIQVMACQRQP